MSRPLPPRYAADGRRRRPRAFEIIAAFAALLATAGAAGASDVVPVSGPHTLTVVVAGHGRVTRDPDLVAYPTGSTVLLHAIPDQDWVLSGWGGSASGSADSIAVVMDDDRVITATFELPILIPGPAVFPNYSLVLPPAWGDYDNDGFRDLPLYHNERDGTFTEIPGFRDILNQGNYHGASWCDYDRDGDLDLALLPYEGEELGGTVDHARAARLPAPDGVTMGKARLFRNDNGTLVDVAPSLGMDKIGFAETAVWGDFDGDGWPDLFEPFYTFLPPYQSFFFHNNGDGTFTEQAILRGLDLAGVPEALKPEGAHAIDIDDDGDLDLYCASHLFVNDGNGFFADARTNAGLPEVFDEGSMFVDYDNDGDLDLSLRVGPQSRLYRNDHGSFVEVTAAAGLLQTGYSWGDSWADVDNDGDLDHYLARPGFQPGTLMLNQGDGTFVRDETFRPSDSSGLSAWADFDHDGDMDLHVEGYDRHLFVNTRDQRPGYAGSWLRVIVLGALGHRTQHGATVRLRRVDGPPGNVQTRVVDGGSGYLTQSEYTVHFGVDPAGTYALEVSFPSRPGARAILGPNQLPWLGNLVPGQNGGHTITVFRDGRAHVGDWQVSTSTGEHGSIEPAGTLMVPSAVNQRFTVTPAVGFRIADVVVDGVSAGPVTEYTFVGVTRKHTISARFEPSMHTVSVDVVGGGQVTRTPDQPAYAWGSTVRLSASPAAGYQFGGWSGDAAGNDGEDVELTVNGDLAVTATFAIPRFEDTPITFSSYGAGGLPPAWGDVDDDGDPDLPLYRNDGGGTFPETPGFREFLHNGNYHGGAWCDYDKDGDLDLWLQPYSANGAVRALLMRNLGDGAMENAAPDLGMDVSGLGATPTWADFDGDGWPDLFAPFASDAAPHHSFLWHNNGNGTFTDVAAAAGVDLTGPPASIHPEGTAVGDFDDDGDVDLYSAGRLLRNNGTGSFTDVRTQAGLPLVQDGAARFVDFDRDGDLDLSLRSHDGPQLFRNDGVHFAHVSEAAGFTAMGFAWGDNWADVDNDGDLDAYLCSPGFQPGRLMLNQGDGTFVPDPTFYLFDSSGPAAWGDADRDGDLDLHVQGNKRHLFRNRTSVAGEGRSWLCVVVVGAEGRRSEAGATVRLRRLDVLNRGVQTAVVDGGSGYLAQNEYPVHFGVLPEATYALSVSFPSSPLARVVVDASEVAWLGALVPGALQSHTITVSRNGTAQLGDWTITASAGPGGAVTPGTSVPVDHGGNLTFSLAPDPGHYISDVVVDNESVGPVAAYTFSDIRENHQLAASFVRRAHLLTVKGSTGGHVIKNPDLPYYPWGTTVELTAVPDPGYRFVNWEGDLEGAGNPASITIDRNKRATANFARTNATAAELRPVPFGLDPVTPNPVHGVARIAFGLPAEAPVRLDVLDLEGRSVAALIDRALPAGNHSLTWQPGGLPAGLYFIRLQAAERRLVRRVVFTR